LRSVFLTMDHSFCWLLCPCLLSWLFYEDEPQLTLAFVQLSNEVCVFDDPFKRKTNVMCLFLGFLSGVDEISVLTGMWHSVTGCFVADVSILQCCMSTEIFFFVYFMFSCIRSVVVNCCFMCRGGCRKMSLYGPIIYYC
jgi:hypothetical protein